MQGKTARSRGTLTEKRYSVSMMITLAQKASFETFYEDDLMLGTLTFTHAGWSTGATETYVLMAPPKFQALGAGLFTLALEVVSL
jgi:hypothetical protein